MCQSVGGVPMVVQSVSECLCELLLPLMIRWLLTEPPPPVHECMNAGLCCSAPDKIRKAINQFNYFSVNSL